MCITAICVGQHCVIDLVFFCVLAVGYSMQAKSYCHAYSVLYKMCRILIILSGAL